MVERPEVDAHDIAVLRVVARVREATFGSDIVSREMGLTGGVVTMYDYPPEVKKYELKVSSMEDWQIVREVYMADRMNSNDRSTKWYLKHYLRHECEKRKLVEELSVVEAWQ